MIDYVSIEYKGDIEPLLSNPLLDYKIEVSVNTGEVLSEYRIAKYKNFEIRIYNSGRAFISGSLHCYYHEDARNDNRFSYSQLIETITVMLIDDLCIDPRYCLLHNVEFGVNIKLPTHIDRVQLFDGLMTYKGKMFKDRYAANDGYNRIAHLNHYKVKCYDKSAQYSLNDRLVRYELHYSRMSTLNNIGIYYLIDLVDHNLLNELGAKLVESWGNIIYVDPMFFHHRRCESQRYWGMREYWVHMYKETPRSNRNKICREVKRMREVMENAGCRLQEEFSQLIKSEWETLFYS